MAKQERNQPTAALPRREREKQQRRNSIIDAAQNLFFQRGFDGVSMDEIARDLELSKPALYRYFRNKESLYLAVVLRGMVTLRDTLKEAVEKEKTGRQKILGYVRSFCFNYARGHPDYYRLVVVAREQRFMDMFIRHEVDGAEQFGNMAFELLNLLINAINLGIKDGTVREDLDPLQTAVFLVVSAEATVNLTPAYKDLITRKNIGMDDYLQNSIDLMLRGIASESP